jgi:hypothetical protein
VAPLPSAAAGSRRPSLGRGYAKALFAAIVGALAIAAPAGASVTAPVQVTGPSPFGIGCAGAGHDSTGEVSEEAEVEPWVAVDQTDPNNVSGS